EKRLRDAADTLRVVADHVGQSQIASKGDEFTLTTSGVPAGRMADFIRAVLGDWFEPNGIRVVGADRVTLQAKADVKLDESRLRSGLEQVATQVRTWAGDLADAQVQAVETLEPGEVPGASFEIVSRVTSKDVLVAALLSSMSDVVDIPQQVS